MDQQFVNIYIENLAKRLGDLVKNEILLQTQLDIANKIITDLTNENKQLKDSINKKKSKEVNTSDTF